MRALPLLVIQDVESVPCGPGERGERERERESMLQPGSATWKSSSVSAADSVVEDLDAVQVRVVPRLDATCFGRRRRERQSIAHSRPEGARRRS